MSTMHRTPRLSRLPRPAGRAVAGGAVAGLLAVAALPLAVSPAAALSPAPTGPALELVLDASGSMAGADPSGGSKLDAARRALGGLLQTLPDDSAVGVRVYGGQYADQQRGCNDTRLVVPVAPLTRPAAAAALAAVQPVGYTPLAASLRAAAADLPAGAPRTVVLVSDGEETCGGDPCAVAAELARTGVGLRVDTVGYGVDARARDQLGCIARATGGTYREAPDGDALTVELARVAQAAPGLRSYTPTGTPTTGSPEPVGAPVLEPGQYLDALDPAERAHYAVDLADGVTPYLAATLVHPPGKVAGSSFDSVTITVFGPDGRRCGSVSETTSQSNGGTASTAVARPGTIGAPWRGTFSAGSTSQCGRAGRYTFSVDRDKNGAGQAALPVEVRVLVEPPVVDLAQLPTPPVSLPEPLPAPAITTPLTPVTGGGSFATAALLQPGSSTDTVRPGETLYYRVPVGWGQRVGYTVAVPPAVSDTADVPSAQLRAFLASPTREEVEVLGTASSTDFFGGQYDRDGAIVSGSTAPVLFRNRDVDEDALATTSLAGEQFLVVHLGTSDASAAGVPLRIALQVTGEPAGTPRYGSAAGATAPTGPSSVPSTGATAPPAGAGTSGATSSGDGATSDRAEGATADDGTSWRTVAWTGGGVTALVLAGALVVPLLGRRRAGSRR